MRDRDIRYVLFRFFLLAIILISLIIILSYLITRRPLVNTLTMIGIISLCLILYRLSGRPERYGPARISFLAIATFLYIPFGFLTSPGSDSSMPGYILLIIMVLTLLAVEWWEYLFPLMVTAEHILLMRWEWLNPDVLIPFASSRERVVDLSINYSIISLFVMAILIFIIKVYHSQNRVLHSRSVTDDLTGLFNKRYLDEYVPGLIDRCRRSGDKLYAMFIDLNNFKRINDTLGHVEGDKVLREVAHIIGDNTRSYDITARYGGDEFLILLPSPVKQRAEKQIKRLDEAFSLYSQRYREQEFSVSFGLAELDEDDFKGMLKRADERLYRDKAERKAAQPGS